MIARDLIVAAIALGLGFSMLQVAIANRGWCFDTMMVRQIETSRGRLAARRTVCVAGSCIVLMGAWIAASPVFFKSSGPKSPSPSRDATHQSSR